MIARARCAAFTQAGKRCARSATTSRAVFDWGTGRDRSRALCGFHAYRADANRRAPLHHAPPFFAPPH